MVLFGNRVEGFTGLHLVGDSGRGRAFCCFLSRLRCSLRISHLCCFFCGFLSCFRRSYLVRTLCFLFICLFRGCFSRLFVCFLFSRGSARRPCVLRHAGSCSARGRNGQLLFAKQDVGRRE